MRSLILGILVGGALMWAGLQYHVLRTKDGFVYVPKRHVTLVDTYHDVREWGITEWTAHPDLALALTEGGKAEVMGQSTIQTTLKDMLNVVK